MHFDTFIRAAAACALIIGAVAFFAYVVDDDELPATATITTTVVTTRAPQPRQIAESPVVVAEEPAYVGNTRSKKLHKLSCRYANCTNCTARFATREAGIAAGYQPGGCCHP